MGWGIEFIRKIKLNKLKPFDALVYFHKPSFSEGNLHQIEDVIRDTKEEIETTSSQLKMFCAADPMSIIPKEWDEDPIMWLNIQIDHLINSLRENTEELYKLELYKEYLQEKENNE